MFTLMDPRDLEAGMIFEGHIIGSTEVIDVEEGPVASLVVRGIKGGRPIHIVLDGTPIIRFRDNAGARHARISELIHKRPSPGELAQLARSKR